MSSSYWPSFLTYSTPAPPTALETARTTLVAALHESNKLISAVLQATESGSNSKVLNEAAKALDAQTPQSLQGLEAYLHELLTVERDARIKASQISSAERATLTILPDREWVAFAKEHAGPNAYFGPTPGTWIYEFCQLFWSAWKAKPLGKLIPLDPSCINISNIHTFSFKNDNVDTSVLEQVNAVRAILAGPVDLEFRCISIVCDSNQVMVSTPAPLTIWSWGEVAVMF